MYEKPGDEVDEGVVSAAAVELQPSSDGDDVSVTDPVAQPPANVDAVHSGTSATSTVTRFTVHLSL